MSPPFRGTLALLALPLLLSASLAASNPLQTDLESRWVGNVFFLRGFPSDNLIRTDATGKPLSPEHAGPWTLASIEVLDVKISKHDIRIDGERVAQVYDLPSHSWQARPLHGSDFAVKIQVRIENPAQLDANALQAALFYKDADEVSRSLPEYWRDFVANQPPPTKPTWTNGATPPKVLSRPDPEFTPAARQLRAQAEVDTRIAISARGDVTDAQIVRPAGAGLDEKAVECVRLWKFQPARDATGKPMPTTAVVTMTFKFSH